MSDAFRTTRRVEFCHTDAAGIAHFASFFNFMEQAEHELLRSVGLSVVMHDAEGKLSWPRVAVQADYTAAANFEDVLEIEVRIARLGERSITYAFRFTRGGDEDCDRPDHRRLLPLSARPAAAVDSHSRRPFARSCAAWRGLGGGQSQVKCN